MGTRLHQLSHRTRELDRALGSFSARVDRELGTSIARLLVDLRAVHYHASPAPSHRPVVVILGGTGTGKSTLVNRLLDASVSATSFRRTYTAGAVAITGSADALPKDWLNLEHRSVSPGDLPVRGEPDVLFTTVVPHELLNAVTLVDTPDLDGDQPAHHVQADRAFRFADAVLFLVTPEKYQMTELPPYYRLAGRYGVPGLYVMNKADSLDAVVDYNRNILPASARVKDDEVFVIPRDDAPLDAPPQRNLAALRNAIAQLHRPEESARFAGVRLRLRDALDRLFDQVIEPLSRRRQTVDQLREALSNLHTPDSQADVSQLLVQLQRRMRERSVLYLIGPQRIFDRVRQVPSLIARLPRHTWDLVRHGKVASASAGNGSPLPSEVPDFPAILRDQFRVLLSRIDDVVRSEPALAGALDDEAYARTRLSVDDAAQIASSEIDELRAWIESRWNATPRDTAIINKLLKAVPGGQKLTKFSEAAPYVLAVVVATHHAFFGPLDLAILAGYGLVTLFGERMSNEVAARARDANQKIAMRFEALAQRQIRQTCEFLDRTVPAAREIQALRQLAETVAGEVGEQ